MVVGGEEIHKEQAWTVARVRTKDSELVGGCGVVDRRRDDHVVCGAWPGGTRCGSGAIQIGGDRSLVEILETGKVNAIRAVVANVKEPSGADLALNVKAPLLRIRRLVIYGHSSLNREGRGA